MAGLNVTDKQLKLIMAMFQQAAAQNIKYDWNALATDAGYATEASARTAWHHLKPKMKSSGNAQAPPKRKSNAGAVKGDGTPSAAKRVKVSKVEDSEQTTSATDAGLGTGVKVELETGG